jgi:hypothetical protein|uniref:Uncharacterized protein n=1 Tax=Faecalibaculum rodentium TaxID=1702221 RepID=A0A140DS89_9FIRM|nr:hypothetical protein AALO17_03820 [Faecalibaculum rodentium]
MVFSLADAGVHPFLFSIAALKQRVLQNAADPKAEKVETECLLFFFAVPVWYCQRQ